MKINEVDAGEGEISRGAQSISPRARSLTVAMIAAPSKSRITQPIYDPNVNARKCSTCGSRDRWQRLIDGGWYCCWVDTTRTYDPEMAHVCASVCVGAA